MELHCYRCLCRVLALVVGTSYLSGQFGGEEKQRWGGGKFRVKREDTPGGTRSFAVFQSWFKLCIKKCDRAWDCTEGVEIIISRTDTGDNKHIPSYWQSRRSAASAKGEVSLIRQTDPSAICRSTRRPPCPLHPTQLHAALEPCPHSRAFPPRGPADRRS